MMFFFFIEVLVHLITCISGHNWPVEVRQLKSHMEKLIEAGCEAYNQS